MAAQGRKSRDHRLLDALDALERVPFDGRVWRSARDGRDPLQGHPSGGRRDPGTFDVLYTALMPEGAAAEVHFHLSRQPVFPSKIQYCLFEIRVATKKTLTFADLAALEPVGVDRDRYTDVLYPATQAIGDAAHFLGFDGIIAPSARWPCQNLIVFTDRVSPEDMAVTSSTPIVWDDWRDRLRAREG